MNFSRLLNSSKFQGAFVGSLLALVPFVFGILRHIPLEQMQAITATTIAAIGVAWGAAIHGTGAEDTAEKGNPSPSPISSPDGSVVAEADVAKTQSVGATDPGGVDGAETAASVPAAQQYHAPLGAK